MVSRGEQEKLAAGARSGQTFVFVSTNMTGLRSHQAVSAYYSCLMRLLEREAGNMRLLRDCTKRETCRQALALWALAPLSFSFLPLPLYITVIFQARNGFSTAWGEALGHINNFQDDAVKPPVEPDMLFKHRNSKSVKIGQLHHFAVSLPLASTLTVI
jgi:hypothetical protein